VQQAFVWLRSTQEAARNDELVCSAIPKVLDKFEVLRRRLIQLEMQVSNVMLARTTVTQASVKIGICLLQCVCSL